MSFGKSVRHAYNVELVLTDTETKQGVVQVNI